MRLWSVVINQLLNLEKYRNQEQNKNKKTVTEFIYKYSIYILQVFFHKILCQIAK